MEWARIVDWIAGLGAWAGLVITGIVGIVLWRVWPLFAPRREVDAVRQDIRQWRETHGREHAEVTARLDRGEARFAHLEGRIDSLPTARDIQALRDTLADLRAELAAVRETNVWIRDQVQLLVRHELEGGKG